MENDVLRQAPLFSALDDEAAAALRSSMGEIRL
ncbi:MAG: Crp/Fnr family transcriptional regulator, partial [Marmoricola sp.]|nr:Crp/Fnr family transcriptional regulator [Marmoricola sp.]